MHAPANIAFLGVGEVAADTIQADQLGQKAVVLLLPPDSAGNDGWVYAEGIRQSLNWSWSLFDSCSCFLPDLTRNQMILGPVSK